VTLPDTLQAAITNRIDSLNPSQQLTLKVASVIGRIFAFRVLQAVHPIESDKPLLGDTLENLTRLSLTLVESETPDLAYIFKHAVTQEVAYNLMLYSQRRQLHEAVAEWIERSYERDLSSYYNLLAYHWSQAAIDPDPATRQKVVNKAVEYLEKAGDQSLNNFANAEAVQSFASLLEFREHVQPTRLRLGQWYRKLGIAHLGMGNLNEARANLLKALETLGRRMPASSLGLIGGLLGQLARQTGHRLWPNRFRRRVVDPEETTIRIEVVQILQQYASVIFLMGDPNPLPMFHSVVLGLNLAETIRDTAELAYMYSQMGAICGFIPARGQAKHYTEQWRIYNERNYNPISYMSSVIALATVESGIGAWEELRERMERVIEISLSIGDYRQAGEALSFLASNAVIEGNVETVQRDNVRLWENALRRDNSVHVVWSHQWVGSILARLGNLEQTQEVVQKALDRMKTNPVGEVAECVIYGIRAHLLWQQGQHEVALKEARALADRASKMQVVNYSIYIGFAHFMEVFFLALEKALAEGRSRGEKDELLKYARLSVKIMKAYARIFTVGEPILHRFQGWVDWCEGKQDKALQSWRAAADKAAPIPMHYEEGMACLALVKHLPEGNQERAVYLERAIEAFTHGGFANWTSMAQSLEH
jgi:tetratricopeptide (TPR) repeat protein